MSSRVIILSENFRNDLGFLELMVWGAHYEQKFAQIAHFVSYGRWEFLCTRPAMCGPFKTLNMAIRQLKTIAFT